VNARQRGNAHAKIAHANANVAKEKNVHVNENVHAAAIVMHNQNPAKLDN